jgi:hypothetical protein
MYTTLSAAIPKIEIVNDKDPMTDKDAIYFVI